MEIRLNIPDELVAQARARGLQPEALVQEILAKQTGRQAVKPLHRRTPEEVRAWLDSLAQFSDKVPPLPEVVSREWIYQDHD